MSNRPIPISEETEEAIRRLFRVYEGDPLNFDMIITIASTAINAQCAAPPAADKAALEEENERLRVALEEAGKMMARQIEAYVALSDANARLLEDLGKVKP